MTSGSWLATLLQFVRIVSDATVETNHRVMVTIIVGLHLFAMVLVAVGGILPAVLRVPIVVLALTFVPGALTLLAARDSVSLGARELLYALGLSLSWLMAVGLAINLALPLVGISRPLTPGPLTVSISLLVVLLAGVVLMFRPSGSVTLRTFPLDIPILWGLLLLPMSSILAVGILNRTNNNVPLLIVLVIIALAPLAVLRWLPNRWHGLATWSLALAVLYHKSLWQYAGFSGEPSGIITWSVGRWTPGVLETGPTSAELLPNALLFPTYAHLTGLPILAQYEVVNPFFVSFIPLSLYVMFRRYANTRVAFLGATLFVFAHPFYLQYPTAGRAATPVLFLALFGVVLADDVSTRMQASTLGLIFISGLIVSHYGSSYFVAFVFVWSLILLYVLDRFDDILSHMQKLRVIPSRIRGSVRWGSDPMDSVFGWSFVSFYLVGAIAWYLYANAGEKFAQLPRHVVQNIEQLTAGDIVEGRTAARVQRDYGSTAIELSKDIYILLGLLMLIGLVALYYDRLRGKDRWDDRFIALSTTALGTFGLTFFLRNWGGGRPMMITLVFTAVLSVVGLAWIGRVASIQQFLAPVSLDELAPYSVILAVLLLLNTGVASAVVLGGSAPSNVPLQPTLDERSGPGAVSTLNKVTDISTHVWTLEHVDSGVVRGDTFALRQRDWYRPEIVAKLENPLVNTSEIQFAGYPPPGSVQLSEGYFLVLGHNQALDVVWNELYSGPSAELENYDLDSRNRIYTTGNSSVYHSLPD